MAESSAQTEPSHLLQADLSVSSSGETYWAVPTKELALAARQQEYWIRMKVK